MNPYVIGITGVSCAGKSTVCDAIIDKIKSKFGNLEGIVAVVSQDAYYRGGNKDTNYDVPESLDFKLMAQQIRQLMNNEIIDSPIYDFTIHGRKKEIRKIGPAKIIIIEGILIFTQKEIRDLCNLKIYISSHPELVYYRRLKRDTAERGRTIEEVNEQYFRDVLPSARQLVEPTEDFSDIVIKNNTHNQFVGLVILLDHIEKKINELKNELDKKI
jgi:uridine kinase